MYKDSTHSENDIIFNSGYKLKKINKNELLTIIQYICKEENFSYFISTRSCGDKGENFYYIVLSIIQYSKDKKD